MEATIKRSLDRRNKSITTFVIYDAAEELETMDEGEALEIFTDEFEPFEWDIAAWCQSTGHVMVASEPTTAGHRFVIEKRTPKTKDSSMAIVISSGLAIGTVLTLGVVPVIYSLFFRVSPPAEQG